VEVRGEFEDERGQLEVGSGHPPCMVIRTCRAIAGGQVNCHQTLRGPT
jgi:hypothetical protein